MSSKSTVEISTVLKRKILKTKILLISILLLIGLNIYTIVLYEQAQKEVSCYAKKYKNVSNGVKSMFQMRALTSLENLILLFDKLENLKLILYADSSIYLKALGNKDYAIYKPIEHNSTICNFWTKQTKKQYKDTYLEITQLKDFNASHESMLKGLDIVNNICLEEK